MPWGNIYHVPEFKAKEPCPYGATTHQACTMSSNKYRDQPFGCRHTDFFRDFEGFAELGESQNTCPIIAEGLGTDSMIHDDMSHDDTFVLSHSILAWNHIQLLTSHYSQIFKH